MDNYRNQEPFRKDGLYDPRFEHENCGIGAVVNMSGKADHKVVDNALRIVETLEHRAGKDAEGKTGDGVGILLQISHNYFSKAVVKDGISIGGKREYGIGMFFFPQSKTKCQKAMETFEKVLKRKKILNYWVGVKYRLILRFWEQKLLKACLTLCRHLLKNRTAVKKVLHLTVNFI